MNREQEQIAFRPVTKMFARELTTSEVDTVAGADDGNTTSASIGFSSNSITTVEVTTEYTFDV